MKALNISIGVLFCSILVVVWFLSERADPVMLQGPGPQGGHHGH